MVSADVVKDINTLQPNEQTLVLSLLKSLMLQRDRKNAAQLRFEEECAKYGERKFSMEEIEGILHGE